MFSLEEYLQTLVLSLIQVILTGFPVFLTSFSDLILPQVAFWDIHAYIRTYHTCLLRGVYLMMMMMMIILKQTELWYWNSIGRYPNSGIGIGSEKMWIGASLVQIQLHFH